MRILHLGCGRKGIHNAEHEFINLDADSLVNPDIVCTLGRDPIPLPDDHIDLAVAIHVLEHIGKQGETKEWFQFWEELYRVLKPGGKLQFESPMWNNVWSWADPSHTRVLSPEAFCFFHQDNYRIKGNTISPFRILCDFIPEGYQEVKPNIVNPQQPDAPAVNFRGILVAKKPLVPWWEG